MPNTASITAPKEAALNVISRLDERASYDDIMYEMYVLQKIERGEKDIAEGKVFSKNDAKTRLSKWLK